MGIYNRDYLRDSSASGGYGHQVPTSDGIVKKIVVVTIGVFILQLLFPSATRWLVVDFRSIVFQGQVWRLITYAFAHSTTDLWHIVFNLWVFWAFGREIEAMYGSKEFTWFYLVSAVFAGVCYLVMGFLLGDLHPMLGASGAVTAVFMLCTLHFPRRVVYLFGLIRVEMRWLMAFFLVWDLHPILLQMGHGVRVQHVAHAAHLGGALFGWFYFRRQIRLSSLVGGVGLGARLSKPRKKVRSNLKIFAPPSEGGASKEVAGEQVDAILAKISEHGESSLTDHEREVLKRASRQYRNR